MRSYENYFNAFNSKKMIDKNKITLAAQKWAIDTKKNFPHLSEPEFIAGAEWAFEQVDPLCNDGAEIIEKLQSENAKLKEVLEIARRYAVVEYGESASCRVIASEIQQAFPAESNSA